MAMRYRTWPATLGIVFLLVVLAGTIGGLAAIAITVGLEP